MTGRPGSSMDRMSDSGSDDWGSNPTGITEENPQEIEYQRLADFSLLQLHHICTTKAYGQGL